MSEIKSLSEYLKLVKPSDIVIYRGHPSKNYDLRPSVARGWFGSKDELVNMEKNVLSTFKKQSVPFIKYHPEHDLEWLVLMQHHGAPTRLLDWTFNPIAGLFFAVYDNEKEDGEVFEATYSIHKDLADIKDIFQSKSNFVFTPRHITERIGPQSGCFIVFADPTEAIPKNSNRLNKYIIPKDKKKQIREELMRISIHEGVLFPGLDGLCKSLKSYITKKIFASVPF